MGTKYLDGPAHTADTIFGDSRPVGVTVDQAIECLSLSPYAQTCLMTVAPEAYGDRPVSLAWALAQTEMPIKAVAEISSSAFAEWGEWF